MKNKLTTLTILASILFFTGCVDKITPVYEIPDNRKKEASDWVLAMYQESKYDKTKEAQLMFGEVISYINEETGAVTKPDKTNLPERDNQPTTTQTKSVEKQPSVSEYDFISLKNKTEALEGTVERLQRELDELKNR